MSEMLQSMERMRSAIVRTTQIVVFHDEEDAVKALRQMPCAATCTMGPDGTLTADMPGYHVDPILAPTKGIASVFKGDMVPGIQAALERHQRDRLLPRPVALDLHT